MEKVKFMKSSEYDCKKAECFEKVKKGSKTVQGEAYTIPELFERHMKGMMVNVQREAYFDDVAEFDSVDMHAIKYADIHEKELLLAQVREKAKKAEEAIKKWRLQEQAKTQIVERVTKKDDEEGSKTKVSEKAPETSKTEPK